MGRPSAAEIIQDRIKMITLITLILTDCMLN